MELVDVADSKSAGGDIVWVRVPSPAPNPYNPNLFPIGHGFGLLVFFERYERTRFPQRGGAQASLQAERLTEEASPINAKRAGAAVNTVRPPFLSLPSVVLLSLHFPPLFHPAPPAGPPRARRKQGYPAWGSGRWPLSCAGECRYCLSVFASARVLPPFLGVCQVRHDNAASRRLAGRRVL